MWYVPLARDTCFVSFASSARTAEPIGTEEIIIFCSDRRRYDEAMLSGQWGRGLKPKVPTFWYQKIENDFS